MMARNPDHRKMTSGGQGPSLMSRMALNDNKAGMEGLDKERINQIIYNASKGSKFFVNERKKEEQLNEKIKEQQSVVRSISAEKMQEGQLQADLLLESMQQQRDFSHTIVHVDMDAFYAAVEMRDDPTLKAKPMAVGGMGMLSTSNYLARKFGVRAAMPGFIGLKLCPDLVIVKPNFEQYTAVSQQVRQVLAVYDPNFCPMSLDEAYLDFGPHLQYRATAPTASRTFILRQSGDLETPHSANSSDWQSICACDLNCVLLPSILESLEVSDDSAERDLESFIRDLDTVPHQASIPKTCSECQKTFPRYCLKVYGLTIDEAVLEMRNRIEQRTFLTASAGIAPNMMLAKVCSDKNKPNGQFRIPPDEEAVDEFMKDLPIRKISGIGKVTERFLGAVGVIKCSDIHQHSALLYHLFSTSSFQHFMQIYLGLGSTVVQRDDERKSMSTERTFNEVSDKDELYGKCEEMSTALSEDLRDERLKGKTVTLKIKSVSFEVKTRSQTLQIATNDPSVINAAAKQLLLTEIKTSHPEPLRLRLMGVRMSKLVPEERREVNVKDMFRKLTSGSAASASSTQVRPLGPELVSESSKNEAQLLHEINFRNTEYDDEDCVIISSACNSTSASERGKKGSGRTTESKKGKQRGMCASSESIVKFLTQDVTSASNSKGQTEDIASRSLFMESGKMVSQSECLDEFVCHSSHGLNHKRQLPEKLGSASNASTSTSGETCEDLDSESFSCPICGATQANWDLSQLNSHVDICLSQQTIRDILNEDKRHKVSHHSVVPDSDASTSLPSSGVTKQLRKRVKSNILENGWQSGEDKPKKIQRSVASYFHSRDTH